MGLKEKLAGVSGLKEKTITVDEWGFDVLLREPTAGESIALAKLQQEGSDNITAGFEILAMCVHDEEGRVFKDAAEAEAALGSKGMGAIVKLIRACSELMGVDIEAALKNLKETPDGDPSSD